MARLLPLSLGRYMERGVERGGNGRESALWNCSESKDTSLLVPSKQPTCSCLQACLNRHWENLGTCLWRQDLSPSWEGLQEKCPETQCSTKTGSMCWLMFEKFSEEEEKCVHAWSICHVPGICETFDMHVLFSLVLMWFPGARYYYRHFTDCGIWCLERIGFLKAT